MPKIKTRKASKALMNTSLVVDTGPAPHWNHVDKVMSFENWSKLPTHPNQRDTEKHARQAHYLRTFIPEHQKVEIIHLPFGAYFPPSNIDPHGLQIEPGGYIKADGHTRCMLWNSTVQGPDKVFASVFVAMNAEQAIRMYKTRDADAAKKGINDQMVSAMAEVGFTPATPLLKNGTFASSLKLGYAMAVQVSASRFSRDHDLLKAAMQYFLPALNLLDQVGVTKKKFPTGVLIGALFSLLAHGDKASNFFTLYANGQGNMIDGKMDAVAALNERIKAYAGIMGGGQAVNYKQLKETLSAVEAYLAGNRIRHKTGIKELPKVAYEDFLNELREKAPNTATL